MDNSLYWTTEKRKISELKPYYKNPRKLPPEQAKKLKESLQKFNLAEIPAINTEGTIIAGHQRISMLREIGSQDEIDVRIPSRPLTDKEVEEYNIRSNVQAGEWDFDILGAQFDARELKEWGLDINFNPAPSIGNTDPDDVPEKKETTTIKTGDLFQLGSHRLLCGDSSKKEDVEKFMDGKKAVQIC